MSFDFSQRMTTLDIDIHWVMGALYQIVYTSTASESISRADLMELLQGSCPEKYAGGHHRAAALL